MILPNIFLEDYNKILKSVVLKEKCINTGYARH